MITTGRLGQKHFDPAKQAAMITGHGQAVAVFPCVQCPCLTDEQQFDPLCLACEGTGRLYLPQLAYATMLLMTQESSKRTYLEPGTWNAGTVLASVLPGVHLDERDKIRAIDMRATGNDTALMRGIDDQLRNLVNIKVEIVADRDRVYSAGRDYVFVPPDTIRWLSQALAFGEQYSVRFTYTPEYVVLPNTPRLRIEHRVAQSQEVVLMLLDSVQKRRV